MKYTLKYFKGNIPEIYAFDNRKKALEFLKNRFAVDNEVATAELTGYQKIGWFTRLWRIIGVYLMPRKYANEVAQRFLDSVLGVRIEKEIFKNGNDVIEELEKLEKKSD